MKIKCKICPHGCELAENDIGFCRARSNIDSEIKCINYGKITSMALDPIEKKPLYHFYPGSKILSVGSFGCNMRCGFCQNHSISMQGGETPSELLTAKTLADKAEFLAPNGNIGIAYTYNEPLIGYEFVLDCAKEIHSRKLKNVLVTNGLICDEPLQNLLPFIDAMNIDLKGFTSSFYKKIHGDLDTVKHTVEVSSKTCHIEVTTLIIPGENDSEEEISALAKWLASVDDNIPYHISRFFPQYNYSDISATDVDKIYSLADAARKYLKYVYIGNC